MMKNEMLRKIENREIVVGVVGLGYVGLPLAVEKAKAGFKTIGFDVQAQKVEMVNAGHNYIGDVVDSDLAGIVKSGMLSATTDFSFVKDVDFVAICVPTPLDAHQQPDISYVRDSATSVSKYLKKGTMVVLESTTYPGTTEELIKPILEQGSGLKCGEDFYLGFSPERVDPGNLIYKTKNTPKVVGAIGKDATEVIAAMYRAVLDGEVFYLPGKPLFDKIKMTVDKNLLEAFPEGLTLVACPRVTLTDDLTPADVLEHLSLFNCGSIFCKSALESAVQAVATGSFHVITDDEEDEEVSDPDTMSVNAAMYTL